MSRPAHSPMGEQFGRYVLLECIGRGGMAEVFRAVAHGVEGFQRVFVVKRILQDKSSSREFIDMFISEARVSALLNHPNIVQIYEFGQVEGSYFLAMEYLRGKDLINVMRTVRARDRHLDPALAAHIAQQVAGALHYAHSLVGPGGQLLGIVHRDVSPSNIMLLRAGGVKLLDFGIARAELGDAPQVIGAGQSTVIKGKLSYLSPEQVRGQPLDARSDIFSLGVVLWEMLTGRRLFYDKTDRETLRNVLERPIIPPSLKRIESPTALDYIVLRALERDPARRYSSAKEMVAELDAYLTDVKFSASTLPRLLDELYGEDNGQFEAHICETSHSGMWATSSGTRPAVSDSAPALRSSASVRPIAIERSAAPLGIPAASAVGRRRWSRGVWMGTTGLLAATIVVLALVLTGSRSPGPTRRVAPAAPSTSSVPAPAPASEKVSSRPLPSSPARVSVRFQTIPRGAELFAADGRLLGTTPVDFELARGEEPYEIVVRKAGFIESRHRIVPDRDISALLTLRLDNRRGRKLAQADVRAEALQLTALEPALPVTPPAHEDDVLHAEAVVPAVDVSEPVLPPRAAVVVPQEPGEDTAMEAAQEARVLRSGAERQAPSEGSAAARSTLLPAPVDSVK